MSLEDFLRRPIMSHLFILAALVAGMLLFTKKAVYILPEKGRVAAPRFRPDDEV